MMPSSINPHFTLNTYTMTTYFMLGLLTMYTCMYHAVNLLYTDFTEHMHNEMLGNILVGT